ncbi:hypothetical protein TRAPUB_9664 [Trametes pubescens]|uniref:Uncharacterized protein n=1 Tax=Trametes pubescens TaxID=154538 RepID=A0A1M2W1T6_TRAPU|nr:hypothetical protein TRAPUB_9664 [Trametes pubescens]
MLAHFDFASTAPIPALQYPLTGPHSHHSIYAGGIDLVIPSAQTLAHSATSTFTDGYGHALLPTASNDKIKLTTICLCVNGHVHCISNSPGHGHRPGVCLAHVFNFCPREQWHALVPTTSDDLENGICWKDVDGQLLCAPIYGHGLDMCPAPAFTLPSVPGRRAQARRSLFNITHTADLDVHAYARELPHSADTVASTAAGPLTPPMEETEKFEPDEDKDSAGVECSLSGFAADESDDQTSLGPPSPMDASLEGEKGAGKAQYWLEMDSMLEVVYSSLGPYVRSLLKLLY